MKNLYLTSAIVLALGGTAFAQTAATETPATTDAPAADAAASDPGQAMETGLLRASALEGVDIFTVDVTGETEWDDTATYTEIDADWDKIGEVEDLILNANGEIVGAIAEVGGFLGLGEKEVVLEPAEVAYVMTEDRIAVVSALSKEALEQREELAEELRDQD
ncbi:PRC-barrel domain-containing protein [Paracoccus aerodenitrificans]|uniref:PRC-barrel domain-containing protein n=1 Tax=Paracoccus aerodenitrificans TaxID=3017781 RepID=UPI0022F12C21|nr:PRC-barrel domain-containing protein [Paracoccus aerodenitrificans]WBU64073.1 PRC-barrel domain-containing protein [Paracoccus aerodenitrificans]